MMATGPLVLSLLGEFEIFLFLLLILSFDLRRVKLTVVTDGLLLLLMLLLKMSLELMMMNADGRVLSPGPVATNDGGRADQFVVGALATELNQ
jgi:hypothetical protein